jgi:type 1 glutamine amidotransferase
MKLPDFSDRMIERENDRVDAVLADSPRDQLRVLRAKIEDENGLVGLHGGMLHDTARPSSY